MEVAPGGAKLDLSAVDVSLADNVLDRWIAAYCRSLVNYVRQEMGAYRLYTVVPYLVSTVSRSIITLCVRVSQLSTCMGDFLSWTFAEIHNRHNQVQVTSVIQV